MSAPTRRYEGLSPSTRTLRWVLAAGIVGLVLLGSASEALTLVGDWVVFERERLPWYVTRASALLGYVALSASVIYGLMLSTGLTDRIAHRAVSVTLHRDLAGVGLALALVHAAVLMIDRSVPYTPLEVVIPFIGPYRPVWIAFGQVAIGAALVVHISTLFRARLSKGTWLRLHRVAFVAWAGATVHGLMSGSDTGDAAVALMYVLASTAVISLFAARLVLAALSRRAA